MQNYFIPTRVALTANQHEKIIQISKINIEYFIRFVNITNVTWLFSSIIFESYA